jgi:Raf kinase inhibitor-like YbhB/YbcL family protein
MRSPTIAIALFHSLALLASGCGKPQVVPRPAPGVQVASITVTSPAFGEGGRIPVDYTCDGKDVLPELLLSSPPERTKSLTIVVEDPDAPSGTFVHMVAFDLPPDLRKLPSGTDLPGEAARFALNDAQVARYSGPCPPRGEAHRYRFRVVALDTMLNLSEGVPRGRVDEAMDGHILGEGALTGLFGH